ncbi:hypothetical protein CR513_07982, partial [Mucuna pruriens]
MAYRTSLRISLYQIVFGKMCHLSVIIKYRAYWTVKRCNLAFDQANKEIKLLLQELEELCLEAYKNSKIYKEKVKRFHDNMTFVKGVQNGPKTNKSIIHPLDILEYVLVQVNELIFPIDFYVLDMEDESFSKGSTLILDRPFLMATRTKIDVHVGTLSMEFGDNMVRFNIFKAMKHPTKNHYVFSLDVIDVLIADCMQLHYGISSFFKFFYFTNFANVGNLGDFECTCDKGTKCSILQKYISKACRGCRGCSKSTSLTIYYVAISIRVETIQEERLLQVLRKHRKAIGQTLADLLGKHRKA